MSALSAQAERAPAARRRRRFEPARVGAWMGVAWFALASGFELLAPVRLLPSIGARLLYLPLSFCVFVATSVLLSTWLVRQFFFRHPLGRLTSALLLPVVGAAVCSTLVLGGLLAVEPLFAALN